MFWGKMVERTPALDFARRRRARTVLSFRVGMFSRSEAAGERSSGVSAKARCGEGGCGCGSSIGCCGA